MTDHTPSGLPQPQTVAEALAALRKAREFIRNGVALGFIRMPDADTPDSAHETLPMIQRAIAALSAPAVETVAVQAEPVDEYDRLKAQKDRLLQRERERHCKCDECGKAKSAGWALYCVECSGKFYATPSQPVGTLTDERIEFGLNCNLEDPSDDESNGFYAGVKFAEHAHGILAATAEPAVAATPQADSAQPVGADTLTDLAHSAYEEAMQFGLSHDLFLRYFRTLASPPRAIPAEQAAPTAAHPHEAADRSAEARKSVSEAIADSLRPFLSPGQKVIWRMPFRWHDDNGVLSNHYDGFSVRGLAEDFGYDVIVDAGEAAIVAAMGTPAAAEPGKGQP